MNPLEAVYIIIFLLVAAGIAMWATCRLVARLWRGEPVRKSLLDWGRLVLEAIFGG
jgi:hypothetical protein